MRVVSCVRRPPSHKDLSCRRRLADAAPALAACECTYCTSTRRASGKCTFEQFRAAAREGVDGAQLVLLAQRSVGLRVSVHWPSEGLTWYEVCSCACCELRCQLLWCVDCRFRLFPSQGVIKSFNASTHLHKVSYDDGDVACHALWLRNVRLLSPVSVAGRPASRSLGRSCKRENDGPLGPRHDCPGA